MFTKILIIVGVLSAVCLGYILVSTTPMAAGATGILAVFLLSYIMSVIVLTFFIFVTHRIITKLFYSDRTGSVADDVTLRRSYYFASIVALGPLILVSLRSVGKIGVMEVALVLFLLAIGLLYVSRQTG